MFFKTGSRTRRRATFFCVASHKDVANAENAGAIFGQKKVAKEKATRLPLMSCAPRICRGTAKGASCPFAAARLPCRALYALGCFGLFPTNAPVLDAANGRKARYCVT